MFSNTGTNGINFFSFALNEWVYIYHLCVETLAHEITVVVENVSDAS